MKGGLLDFSAQAGDQSYCDLAIGIKTRTCLKCTAGYYRTFRSNSFTCSSSCSNGEFPAVGFYTCDTCFSKCSACTGPTEATCTACKDGMFWNLTAQQCQMCDQSSQCLTCKDSKNQCLTCMPGYYLVPPYTCTSKHII